MKKYLNLILFCVGLICCSKKSELDTDQTPLPAVTLVSPIIRPVEQTHLFVGSTWSLALPHGFNKETTKNSTIEGLFSNKENHSLISVVKEPFVGTTQSYAFLGIIELKRAGISTSSPAELNLNGQTITLVEGSDDNDEIHVWVWLTTKNGFGYTLSCGGRGDPAQFRDLCTGLYSSFHID